MPETIALWPGAAPGSEGWRQRQQDYLFTDPRPHRVTRNVTVPTLTPYLPEASRATGAAVIICPGGGHHFLAVDHEGEDVANWLTARGIAAFVLRYRVIETPEDEAAFLDLRFQLRERLQERLPSHWPLALADGQQAVRVVRARAAEWGLRADRIGMMGFSAGAHLAAGVALAGAEGSRIDFVAPIYGALWGEVAVPADAPPMFTALASDDAIAVEPCAALYIAWQRAGRPAEIHCYAQGGHGFGMFEQGLPSDGWIARFHEWLVAQGLTERAG